MACSMDTPSFLYVSRPQWLLFQFAHRTLPHKYMPPTTVPAGARAHGGPSKSRILEKMFVMTEMHISAM